MTNQPQPYNPLSREHLAESVVGALFERPVMPLPPGRFAGAGVYAIYHTGPFDAYKRIAEQNRDGRFDMPIYVGKADPPGSRRGIFDTTLAVGNQLSNRLRQHAASLEAAENLDLADFHCRFLVVEDIWIPLAESLLINLYSPIWNIVLDGFGIHNPGAGRRAQQRSAWDALHPGRPWVPLQAAPLVLAADLRERVMQFLEQA